MTNKQLARTGGVVAAAGLTLAMMAGCASTASSPDSTGDAGGTTEFEPITYTVNELVPETGPLGKAIAAGFDYITEKTDGAVKFDIYWSGALVPPTEALDALESGVADLSYVAGAYFPDDLPVTNWLAQLGSVQESEYPYGMLEGVGALGEFINGSDSLETALIEKEWGERGMTPLYMLHGQSLSLLCTSPVSTTEEAEGKRVRGGGAVWSKEFAALGMSPVDVPYNEVYEALQRGVIDCAGGAGGPLTFGVLGLTESAKYFSGATFSSGPFGSGGYFMNTEKWDAMPDELKTIFREGAAVLGSTYVTNLVDYFKTFTEEGEAAGVEFTDTGDLNKVLASVQKDVIADMVANRPEGLSEEDAKSLVADYEGLRDEWKTLVEGMVDTDALGASGPSGKAIKERYLNAPDAIDWTAYSDALQERTAQ